ncbi:hypothetical protein ACOMHN_033258 [Nucella lapillus]
MEAINDDDNTEFTVPEPGDENDEVLLYLRPLLPEDNDDGIPEYKHRKTETVHSPVGEGKTAPTGTTQEPGQQNGVQENWDDIDENADLSGEVPPTEEFIPEMEKIKNEESPLTDRQQEEQRRIVRFLGREYAVQNKVEGNKKVLRLREQFLHVHGTLGGERKVDAVTVLKAVQMLEQGMRVCVLNLNFLKRLQTLGLYCFLKEQAMRKTSDPEKLRKMVFLQIQEEDADDVDRKVMMTDLNDFAEDWPLFVITDETCKEVERIDDAITDLTKLNRRFHFWSSSSFAHGTPDEVNRYRLSQRLPPPPPIQQVMDMIDIDDDELDIGGRHRLPIRRMFYPLPPMGPDYNIREHLDTLKVHLISHNRTHLERDVWECRECGIKLAEYLNNIIELGKPGLKNNEVFIVGHINRFESKVEISGMQWSLLENDIESEAPFCRRAVRIQDILDTMSGMVVSDSISMRGVDKQIVIIIPNPREKKVQDRVEIEMRRRQARMQRDAEDARLAALIPEEVETFEKPKPNIADKDDEEVLYLRPLLTGDSMDGIHNYRKRKRARREKDEDQNLTDREELSEDEIDYDEAINQTKKKIRRPEEIRFTQGAHQSVLRRAVNSMSRADKDMILDVFTDAPRHAVLFHFAHDDFNEEEAQH